MQPIVFDTRFSNIDFILAENMTFGINRNANANDQRSVGKADLLSLASEGMKTLQAAERCSPGEII